MKLSEIFTQLTYGELSQISIGGVEAGEINEANYPKILPHINLALTALYKRFPLKEGRITVALQSGRVTYPLTSAFSASNRRSRETVKYILDTADTAFVDDIHKVERIYTTSGWELGLNDEADVYSCFTPTATTLRVPAAVVNESVDLPQELRTTELTVVYRANHPLITAGTSGLVPDRVDVELPYSHLEPLLLYIASRMNNPMGMTNEFNAGNNYAAKYEAACAELERVNLRVDQVSQNTKLERNGWV
jgi:hypothetical protein